MKKSFRLKMNFIIAVLFICVLLFPNQKKYGYIQDEGPELGENDNTEWHFTYYSDGDGGLGHTNPDTGESFKQSDWTVNETYGWHEWTYKGTKYVVMAAATQEGLDWVKREKEAGRYKYPFITKRDYIHYFRYGTAENDWNYSTFQFQFVDNGDDTIYNGIVLDTCELALDPSNPAWNTSEGDSYGAKPENTQWLDVHVELDYPEKDKYEKFNGKRIVLSPDGRFNSGQNKTSVTKNIILDTISTLFTLLGDLIQRAIDYTGTNGSNIQIEKAEADESKLEALGDNSNLNRETQYDITQLTYTRSEIEIDSQLQDIIQVDEVDVLEGKDTIKTFNIPNTVENRNGQKETVYTTNTKIPIIPIDFYSSAINKVEMFDVNFFDTSSDNSNKFWNVMNNTVSLWSHFILYIAVALMLTTIIWRSILLVKSSLGDDPKEASESKRMIDNIVKAILLISLIYVIMTVMMYMYQEVVKMFMNGNSSNYLLRINVENVYSFNTNLIGYLKFRTLSTNSLAALGASILYCLMTIVNLICFVGMFLRTIIMGGLVIIAPFTAVMAINEKRNGKGFNITNILNFKNWFKLYMTILWVPLIIIIVYRLVLYV